MRRVSRVVAGGVRTGATLLFVMGLLEALVLLLKRPEPLSTTLWLRLLWSPAIYAAIGAGAGAVAGLLASLLLSYRSMRVTGDSERSSVWSLLMAGLLGFYWVYSVNMIHPGGARDSTALALDAAALVAALGLAVTLWRWTVPRGARWRERALWTVGLVAVLWLPLNIAAAAPAFEHTRVEPRPGGLPVAPPDSPSILFIMVDTLRSDCLSCYGSRESRTPAMDRLAENGVLFEQAVTPEPLTRPAVCTMFTGIYPRTHGVDTNTKPLSQDFETLAEVLRARGYRTCAVTAATVLSAYYGTAQGFDYYYEPTEPWWYLRSDFAVRRTYLSLSSWSDPWVQVPADEVTRRAVAWLEENAEQPFFAFVHYYDPHAPYSPPREYDLALQEGLGDVPRPYEDEQARFAPGFEMPGDYLRQEWLRYLGEIAYVDENIGKLLDFVDGSGTSGGVFVVLVADHGESFGHNTWFSHGTRLYDSEIHVPLIVRGPGVPARMRYSEQVRLTDLCPTLLAMVGARPPEAAQGIDVSPRFLGDGVEGSPRASGTGGTADARAADVVDLPAFSQTNVEDRRLWSSRVSYSVRRPPWKLIMSPELELTEVYNLEDDPAETLNVVERQPAVLRSLGAELKEWLESTERTDVEPADMPSEMKESLRALGYLE